MDRRRSALLLLTALALTGGSPPVAWAQDELAQVGDAAPASQVRFNFKDVPYDLVLDFFSRESGLPIIREAAVPEGSMTFISASAYAFEDALTILNLNLQSSGVQLRREGEFLYLASLQDSARKPSRFETGDVPADARPEEILTLSLPLRNAVASGVGEQIKPMIGPHGSVTAVDSQNMLVLVESAAQLRRIKQVIEAIDSVRPVDSEFRLFKLEHADPVTVVEALKGLVGERQKTIVIDQKGKQRVVEEVSVAGLNIQPDPRTSSVIAVGSTNRIETVEQLIGLLDVPESQGGETQMRTFALAGVSPDEASRQLESLFRGVPKDRKPTVLPLRESGKVTVVAPASLMLQAAALLSEIDPLRSSGDAAEMARVTETIELSHTAASEVLPAVQRLQTDRQRQTVRSTATPDGRSLIVAGPSQDVEATRALVEALDVPRRISREVRVVRLDSHEPRELLSSTLDLLEASSPELAPDLRASLDQAGGSVTLIGSGEAIARFESLLPSARAAWAEQTESRSFDVAHASPRQLADQLRRLARPMLEPADGSPYREPRIEPLDELGRVVVRARPEHFGVLEELVSRLDADAAQDTEFRVIPMRGENGRALLERVLALYGERSAGLSDAEAGPVDARLDDASGHLLVTARPGGMQLFTQLLEQARTLVPPGRTTRIIEVRHVQASELLDPLERLLGEADPIDPSRAVPEPTLRTLERTNALIVTAEDAQHRLIEDFVRRLDEPEPTDLPPLKLLQLRTADAQAIASMLTQQYSKRPSTERLAKPVEVRADAATNTLIVSAHEALFGEIRGFVEELNTERREGPERVTVLIPLKVGRAMDVATAMDRLYPEPPVPLDRRGRPMPWLREAKDVTVSADAGTNALIIDAPADRITSLRELAEKLDRVEVPPVAELRTYRIENADLGAIARTLSALARQGNLSAPPQAGKQAVNVVIETEPDSSTLIVAGDTMTFERVESMLSDLSAVPVEKSLRVVPIANAKAGDVLERAQAIYDAQVAQLPGSNPVEVSADESTNSLMVVADAEGMDRYLGIIDELQRQAGPAREVQMIELRFARAADVVGFLRDLVAANQSMSMRGGPEPVFEPIERTNSILVAAQPFQFGIIEPLVRSLDTQQSAERPPLRILRLRSTDAANLASVLNRTFVQRPSEQRATRPVEVQADTATNTLIVSAHPDLMPEIESIVGELNETQSFDADGREIRIFPLRVARAEELARTIDAMFPEPPMPVDPRTRRPRPDLRQPKEVVVRADPATNSLIVDAPAQRLAGFEQIVRSLDQHQLAEDVDLRTYRLERAEPNSVAQTLRNLAQSGALYGSGQARGAVSTPVTVDVEPESRALIVSGPVGIFEHVDRVVSELDGAGDTPGTGLRMYALRHARVERLQPLLERLLVSRLRELASRQGVPEDRAATLLDVAADRASNTLVVSAPEDVQTIAGELIASLDVPSAEVGRTDVRVVPLTYADATATAALLEQVKEGLDLPSGGEVTIASASGSNAVLLTGAKADLDVLSGLLGTMDEPLEPDRIAVETVVLEHARAEAVAPVVERVLRQESAFDGVPTSQRVWLMQRMGVSEEPMVRVEAERRLNAVVISAPKPQLALALQIIEELDRDPGDASERARAVRVLRLQNAEASELARSIESVFAARDEGETPPTLRVDEGANALIVRADPSQMREIEALVREVDDATLSASRELRTIPIDRSRADATDLARTLQRLMRQRGGTRVEVIDAADLLDPSPQSTPNADPDSTGSDANSPQRPAPGAMPPAAWRALAAAVFAAQPAPPQPQAAADQRSDASGADDALPGVTIAVDPATNSLIVVGAPGPLERVSELARELVRSMPAEPTSVRVVTLPAGVDARGLSNVIGQTVRRIGRLSEQNPSGLTGAVAVTPDPTGSALIVWANETDFRAVGPLIGQLAQLDEPTGLPVRTLRLERADAGEVAQALQGFFRDRAAASGQRGRSSVAIAADRRSGSLIVAASDEDYEQLVSMAELLDAPSEARELRFKIVRLEHARVSDIQQTLDDVAWEFRSNRWGRNGNPDADRLYVMTNARTNSVILMGQGDAFGTFESILAGLDQPQGDVSEKIVRPVRVEHGDLNSIRRAVQQATETPGWDWWRGPDPDAVTMQVDAPGRTLILIGKSERVEVAAGYIERLAEASAGEARVVESIVLQHAPADRAARTLQQFFSSQARAEGLRVTPVTVTGSREGNTLLVSAGEDDFAQVRSLIEQLDQPELGDDRAIEVFALKNAQAGETANTIRQTFPRSSRAEDRVLVTPQASTNSLIVSAPDDEMQRVRSLLSTLDAPPSSEDSRIVTVALDSARASEVASALRSALPGTVKIRITPVARTNSLLLTGSDEAVALAMEQIRQLDAEPVRSLQVFRRFTLEHTMADDVYFTLTRMLRSRPGASVDYSWADNSISVSATADDMESIETMIESLDVPVASPRTTEFVKLSFADATQAAEALEVFYGRFAPEATTPGERSVTIVPDPASNSLVISAEEGEWEGIRALLEKLDTEEYDTSRQLAVLPLVHADAAGVARALNEGFRTELRDRLSRDEARRPDRRAGRDEGPREATIVLSDEPMPTVSAEAESNALIVFAGRRELERIRAIVEQLDVPEFTRLAAPRLIPLRSGRATTVAEAVRSVFVRDDRRGGTKAVLVHGDDASDTLIVRADDEQFAQISAMVESLQDEAARADVQPRVVRLSRLPADRMRQLLVATFSPSASQRGETLTVNVDRANNALVIGASETIHAQIMEVVRELDGASAEAPADGVGPTGEVRVVPLRIAEASAVVRTLQDMLRPAQQDSGVAIAGALAEQIRRLRLLHGGATAEAIELDLTSPIRLRADQQSNSVVVTSTAANADAVRDIVELMDTLPIGDAVVVRMFPLDNASAQRVQSIVEDLFRRGDALRRLPGTSRQAQPTTTTGQALAGEIAVALDDRTNTLVVAGREEAVALVEVLVTDLDRAESSRWVEPALVMVEHADAVAMAEKLSRVLSGVRADSAEARMMRQQVARLRVLRRGGDPADPKARLDADLFAPMGELVIEAEESLNALIVVATPANLAVVNELASMLDVPEAAAGNDVRVYPMEFASAERVASLAADVFRQRERNEDLREEDRLIVAPDPRTNSLIASTSPRSFAVLETLLRTLDTGETDYAVGLHVIPTPGMDAAQLASRIGRLMRDRLEAQARSGSVNTLRDTFSVEPDPAGGALIVAASDENLEIVRGLVETLTSEEVVGTLAEQTALIPTGGVQADELADTINEIYVRKENRRRGDRSVGVVANERLNALLVSGTERDIETVRALVDQLAEADIETVQEVKRIELGSANALEVVNLIENVLAGRTLAGSSRGGEQATKLRFYRQKIAGELSGAEAEMTEAQMDDAIRRQVRLTPDLRTNSVVVTAPNTIMGLVEAFVEDLDTTSAGARKIELFRLGNADARAMAEVLRDLFNLSQQGDRLVLIPTRLDQAGTLDAPAVSGGVGLGSTTVTPVPDERQELALTIDARTNTLLVSGTPEYLDLVREVVVELDSIEANEREQLVYHLQNSTAEEVAGTLQEYFREEAERIRQTLGPERAGSLARQLEQEVTVVGDVKSNKLVVSASPRYIETVRQVITELDSAPPQVMIQVLLAEVTLDESTEWGVEASIGPLGNQQWTAGAFASSASVMTALGVPNLSVSNADFSLLIRALETQGKLQVLSRPQLTVNNNEEASIQVGENIAIVNGVERLDNGNTRSDVVRENVGVILNVTPSISSDGFVRMDITPEISTVSQRTTQISEDFESPIIEERRIQTNITVRDGQTVVIGGLIQTSEREREERFPILGELPVIGLPFRSTETDSIRTELLVVLTPRVVPGSRGDGSQILRDMTERAIGEMSIGPRLERAVGMDDPESVTPIWSDPEPPIETYPGPDGMESGATQPIGWEPVWPEPRAATPLPPSSPPAPAPSSTITPRGPYRPE